MSYNYFLQKWKKSLIKLDELVRLDVEYQETKAHDKTWCEAVQRLTGILGVYLFIYNETTDCCQHNLHVQKAGYMIAIIKAIVARIVELKEDLRKLLSSEHQFMGHGLIDHKLTTYDIVLSDIFPKHERDETTKALVLKSIQRAEEKKRQSSCSIIGSIEVAEPDEQLSQKGNWWDNENDLDDTKEGIHKGINVTAVYDVEKKEELTAEMLETRKMATLIQAHERTRKLTLLLTYEKQRREKWEKELNGTLLPPARQEIRERSAKMIQKICRVYFESKRKRFKEYKRDELLSMKFCETLYHNDHKNITVETNNRHIETFKNYEKKWIDNYESTKKKYIEKKHDIIEDDIRDEIMYWFREWFDEASFFRDIPKESDFGSILIVKEEIISPKEWLEKYKASLEEKRANKNKTAHELKQEKLQAKKEKLMQYKAEQSKKKMEAQILKKMMKNPKFHPGYHYPLSKKINHLTQALQDYKSQWSSLDYEEEPGLKEKYDFDFDINNICMDAKMEIRKSVDIAMRETFKLLKKALIEDYKRNGETMPTEIKERSRRKRKQRGQNDKIGGCEDIADKLENLAHRGFLKQYPQIKINDFIGDPNFAGDDLRCKLQATETFSGETKALWWDKCRELYHGSHRILLVGPKGSGKTTLVHILASMNVFDLYEKTYISSTPEAVLYEIDPAWIPEELLSAIYLQELAASIADCARATQPSVIYIKHLHRLFYTKVLPEEDVENLNLIKRYLLRKLIKKVHKSDKITILASCIDPWLTRSKQLLKQFPNVVLMPNTNYSTVIILLNTWLLKNHVIPRNLDIQSLAHALQGYSFGHIQDTLENFLTADRIIRIAAHGLAVHDVYESFLDSVEVKVDYNKYLKWYTDKTHWGKKGKKLLDDQKEFQLLMEKWQQKQKKKKKLDNSLSDVSTNVESKL